MHVNRNDFDFITYKDLHIIFSTEKSAPSSLRNPCQSKGKTHNTN